MSSELEQRISNKDLLHTETEKSAARSFSQEVWESAKQNWFEIGCTVSVFALLGAKGLLNHASKMEAKALQSASTKEVFHNPPDGVFASNPAYNIFLSRAQLSPPIIAEKELVKLVHEVSEQQSSELTKRLEYIKTILNQRNDFIQLAESKPLEHRLQIKEGANHQFFAHLQKALSDIQPTASSTSKTATNAFWAENASVEGLYASFKRGDVHAYHVTRGISELAHPRQAAKSELGDFTKRFRSTLF
jgi:hypothetical protein